MTSCDWADAISAWNKELLYIAGFLGRSAYETELANVRDLWSASAESSVSTSGAGSIDPQVQAWLTGRCLHAMKFFTAYASTPSATVSNLIEASFFACAVSHPFMIMSSIGVRSALEVRIPDETFSTFLKHLPVLPADIAAEAHTMVEALRSRGMIKNILFDDITKELRSRPLSEMELIACMRWWIALWMAGSVDLARLLHFRGELIEAAVLALETGTPNEKIISISSIRTYVNVRTMAAVLPIDGPFPDHTMPVSVTKGMAPGDISSAFGWQELSVLDWIRHIVTVSEPEFDLSTNAMWAERVLNSLARSWPSMNKAHEEIVELLKSKTCIPTRSGLLTPSEAYFPNAHVFSDLPVVIFPKGTAVKGNLAMLLEALGVRKHVELQLVFDRCVVLLLRIAMY